MCNLYFEPKAGPRSADRQPPDISRHLSQLVRAIGTMDARGPKRNPALGVEAGALHTGVFAIDSPARELVEFGN